MAPLLGMYDNFWVKGLRETHVKNVSKSTALVYRTFDGLYQCKLPLHSIYFHYFCI